MKKALCIVFLLLLIITMASCKSAGSDIVGVWEQKMEISILGYEEADSAASVVRFTFLADGTGSQEQSISNGNYPDIIRTFCYELDGSTLTLNYEDLRTEVFSILLDNNSLQMESNRITFQLTRVQE